MIRQLATDWQGAPCWRVLDTCFSDGRFFFAAWQRWRDDVHAPQTLHYVALCASAPVAQQLTSACQQQLGQTSLADDLAPHWFGLLRSFHRFLLADGRVILTVCVGDAIASLRQQDFAADALIVSLDAPAQAGALDLREIWSAKALASCCRRGTRLLAHGRESVDWTQSLGVLRQCGFAVETPASVDTQLACALGQFAPEWTLKSSRRQRALARPIQRCAVIGAGLAGASVAAALARRGWQVQVVDQAAAPAAGASGLPVGLVVPHVSSDDCQLSRLSRAGVRLMLQEVQRCLQPGTDWEACGVLERQIDGTPRLAADWPRAGQEWSQASNQAPDKRFDHLGEALWHPRAAWIKPAALVRAWLGHSGVEFIGNSQVSALRKDGAVWELLDKTGAVCAQAEQVVIANACGARTLLQHAAAHHPALANALRHLPPMQGMRGLLSWGMHEHTPVPQGAFPEVPVNGSGALVAHIPLDQGLAWFMGSSYQPATQEERSDEDNHRRNLGHLQQLLPSLAHALAPTFQGKAVRAWKNERCVALDRLPLVGPLEEGDASGLWLCAAMGSRGLSFSVLCAELLAARMGAEPLPLPVKMAQALHALRA